MADYNSSLPVRTESPGDLDINISDAITPANKLVVEADGSINVNADLAAGSKVIITDGTDDLAINGDGSINSVVTATALDIRPLTNADIVTVEQGTDPWVVSATDLDIRDLSATSDSIAAHLFDEAGNAFTSSNPLPVEFFETANELINYNTASSIAANASSDHTYSAPADFKLHEVYVSGSGKLKAELKIDGNTVAVGFNSTANPMVEWTFQKGINASSVNVVITRTNLDKQPQDLYSSIVGVN